MPFPKDIARRSWNASDGSKEPEAAPSKWTRETRDEAIRGGRGVLSTHGAPCGGEAVLLRKIPYPYRAILAICSDLDETPDRHVYWEIARFLNTTGDTAYGRGVGLETGNTMYFDMPRDQFSYWNTDDAGREMIRTLIRSGHVDCLHSYGDLADTREHALRALGELSRHDCRLEVWIDHGAVPSNFGDDIMRGFGDIPGSPVFHADITWEYGIRYVWRGRVTSIIGQESRRRLRGILRPSRPLASSLTLAKEFAKGIFALAGSRKYAMHGSNRVLRPALLRSGHPVYEFMRANPHWGGVSCGDTSAGLADVLHERVLDSLMEREGIMILYTHLGKADEKGSRFGADARKALERLSRYCLDGRILVTTTRKALAYCRMTQEISVSGGWRNGREWFDVAVDTRGLGGAGGGLEGLTFHVPDPHRTHVTVDGEEIHDLRRNDPDRSGLKSLSFPWKRLEFPGGVRY